MGKEVEQQATARKHTITGIANREEDWKDKELFSADVVIDFSLPETATDNIYRCFDRNIPMVTGTTGWYDKLDEVSEQCRRKRQTLFYAPNFSIGVNLFFTINEFLAALMDDQPDYEAHISETHHIHKKDAPSGTAKRLAEIIIAKTARYQDWTTQQHDAGKIAVSSSRHGEIPGTHEVTYDSGVDTITLKHEAKSRKGFALGAVIAAEWVAGKKGVFTMKDLLLK
jgi:4-hydroxy-tetrahydrodipicolinate reductase